MLAAAPRWAVHRALAEREPSDYCAAGDPDAAQQLGVLPSMEDGAIAYRLLLEVRTVITICNPCLFGIVILQVRPENDMAILQGILAASASHCAAPDCRSSRVFFQMQLQGEVLFM